MKNTPMNGRPIAGVRGKVGNLAQLGGTRHYELTDGKSRGTRAIDVDTGAGLRFTVVPDRAMDISLASYRGTNLVYLTPNGEVHPSYYSEAGMEWLRTFFGGLLTTCGLTYIGSPGPDGPDELGLHGRQSAIPACRVADTSGFDGDEYRITLSGTVEDCTLFGPKLTLTRTITTSIGAKALTVTDEIENLSSQPSPFTVLYHINFGYPLLDTDTEIMVRSKSVEAYEEISERGIARWNRFDESLPGRNEEDFLHTMEGDDDGYAYAAVVNRRLAGGLGVYLRFRPDELPVLTEWKMAGEIDYALGIEPSNTVCRNRGVLRERGMLPVIGGHEKRRHRIEIGIVEGDDEIGWIEQMTRPRSRRA